MLLDSYSSNVNLKNLTTLNLCDVILSLRILLPVKKLSFSDFQKCWWNLRQVIYEDICRQCGSSPAFTFIPPDLRARNCIPFTHWFNSRLCVELWGQTAFVKSDLTATWCIFKIGFHWVTCNSMQTVFSSQIRLCGCWSQITLYHCTVRIWHVTNPASGLTQYWLEHPFYCPMQTA